MVLKRMGYGDPFEYFDHVYVLNLDRRPDRWDRFLEFLPVDWPFLPPQRFSAVDGKEVNIPNSWRENAGAWGCYCTHLEVMHHALKHGFERILVFEDDAIFCEEFSSDAEIFLRNLPADWELAFLGGQHIELHLGRPKQVSETVYSPFNTNRMHAYAMQGQPAIDSIRNFLEDESNWGAMHHVDHFLGEYQKQKERGIYVPRKWLVAQDSGQSDIANQDLGFRAFLSAEDIVHPEVLMPMVAVLGPFSGGTSAVAGVLHHLGVPMGRHFEIPDATNYQGHFEAAELARMCRHMFNEPWMTEGVDRNERVELLRIWAAGHTRTFQKRAHMVGAKHPSFCLLGSELTEAWDSPLFLSVLRDEEAVVNSLMKRGWGWPLDTCLAVTRQLIASREAFLATCSSPVLQVGFEAFRRNPRMCIDDIVSFLSIKPTSKAVRKAIEFIR